MPNAVIYNMAGEKVGEYALSEAVFGVEPNEAVLHAAVKNYLANQRQGTQSALTKGEVSYTTKKPWRQKGTGRARAGYAGSPVWRHGGVAFAPKPRDYRYSPHQEDPPPGPQERPERQGRRERSPRRRRPEGRDHQDQALRRVPRQDWRRRQGHGHNRER